MNRVREAGNEIEGGRGRGRKGEREEGGEGEGKAIGV